ANHAEPQPKAANRARVAPFAREHGAHFLAVLVTKRTRIEMQQPVVCAHHGLLCPLPSPTALCRLLSALGLPWREACGTRHPDELREAPRLGLRCRRAFRRDPVVPPPLVVVFRRRAVARF